MNFHTLVTSRGNGADVVVPVESISAWFANTVYGFFLGYRVAYLIVANYVRNTWSKYGLVKSMLNSSTRRFSFQFRSTDGLDAMLENGPWLSYARAIIKVQADVKLKDTIVVAMPKLTKEGFYTFNVCVEYEWKPLRCACCKVFGHVQDECPNNLDSYVVKNMKKPSQTHRGVPVGPKVAFKPVKKVYKHVAKKKNVNTNSNKKKDMDPTIEVSNLNPFDVLNSVENNVNLGSVGGSPNMTSRKANTSGFLLENVESSSTSNTPMVEKIDIIERLIIEGKGTNVDDKGKPLKKVDYSGDHDSENEVASTDNDMINFMNSKKDGYGNNSLLKQWKKSYMNGDYDVDPYNDDMYEGQDIPEKIQDICHNLDITVTGRKKK
ncbi:reverse transcriptase domain, reverse transcriptase zinc-binding domain protein [Tanacetum coccineum]